jgi:hypothetical protein
MSKSMIAITILALSTSGALAAHHRTHHHAMKESAVAGAPPPVGAPSPVFWTGGVSSSDRDMYARNLRDAGYNPKSNFNANGTIKTQ